MRRIKYILLIAVTLLYMEGCGDYAKVQDQIELSGEEETVIESVVEIETEAVKETKIIETKTLFETENVLQTETIEEILEETMPPEVADDVMVEVKLYIPDIVIQLKYATTDNFTGVQIYESDEKAMLRYGTVKKLAAAQEQLNALGYTIVIWDAHRPKDAQFKLWEVCPNDAYVANPYTGFSSHSRGNTVDITIQTLDGEAVEMPTGFDDFSAQADRDYWDVSEVAKNNAVMLENIMSDCGFKPYWVEWWHYSDTVQYPVAE